MLTTIIFYVFATVLVAAALGVILARNPVHSALLLVLAFFNSAVLWLLLEAEFLALVLVLVYVGAVMVLFLFVVMMLDIDIDSAGEGLWRHLPLAGVVGAVIAVEMALVLMRGFQIDSAPAAAAKALELGNTHLLGVEVYGRYLYPLQVAAALLLVAMISAIVLSLRSRKDAHFVDPGAQVRVTKAERLRIVKLPPTVETPSTRSAAPGEGA